MNKEEEEYVKNIYYNKTDPDSFTTLNKLYKRIKTDGWYDIKKKTYWIF